MLKIKLIFLYKLLLILLFKVDGSPLEIQQHNTNHNKLNKNELLKENLERKIEPSHQFSLIKSYMDQTVDPCEDFNKYACGNWKKQFEIPIHFAKFDIFALLGEKLIKSLLEIISEKQNDIQIDDNFNIEEQVSIFFSSCTDLETINKRGSEPIIKLLSEIGGFPLLDGNKWSPDNYHLEDALAFQSIYQLKSFFWSQIYNDIHGTKNYILYLSHPKLGLKNYYDYLESYNEYNETHLDGYRDLISEVFELLSAPKEQIPTVVNEIIDLETKLANITDTGIYYDILDLYDAVTINILNEKYSTFNWTQYIQKIFDINLNDDDKIVIYGIPITDEIFSLLINTEKRIIANYISWRTIQQMLYYLDERFIASQNKLIKILDGSDQSKLERDVFCTDAVNGGVGMAVSALYVKKLFNEKSKDDILKIGQSILKAFRDKINSYDWIDNEIKALAEEKVDKIILSLGYPDFILNKTRLNSLYEGLHFKKGNFFENVLNLLRFRNLKQEKKFGKEINKLAWPVVPTKINAYFELTKNRILFPAAILQPPIYHADFPKNLNFGAIGFLIGHELTHGFDTKGRTFDAEGNIKNWWNDNSDQQFNDRAQCFIDQYSSYEINNETLDGDLTKGENIADNGGIRLAYKVYTDWLSGASKEEKENEVIPGLNLSPEQLFFISFAQIWCDDIRPEALENLLETDTHLPGKFRTLGVLQNFEEFSKAYQCPLDSPMNPAEKCRLW